MNRWYILPFICRWVGFGDLNIGGEKWKFWNGLGVHALHLHVWKHEMSWFFYEWGSVPMAMLWMWWCICWLGNGHGQWAGIGDSQKIKLVKLLQKTKQNKNNGGLGLGDAMMVNDAPICTWYDDKYASSHTRARHHTSLFNLIWSSHSPLCQPFFF